MPVNPALIAWRSGTGRKQAHCYSHTEGKGHQDPVLGKVKRVVGGRQVERKKCRKRATKLILIVVLSSVRKD